MICSVDRAHNFWYSMDQIERKLDAVFFKTEQGNEPSGNGCYHSPKPSGSPSAMTCSRCNTAGPSETPLVKSMGNGLWEVRCRLEDRIARVIFCVEGPVMVLLHGFIKKTQKTPKHELDLAMKRLNQLRR